MKPGDVKGDAAFTAFQAKLATVVANARAAGITISNRVATGCRCPLGAHPESTLQFPPSVKAVREGWSGVSVSDLACFIAGYSGGRELPQSPYTDLGLAYREMFP